MNPDQLSNISMWIAILAIASLVQMTALAAFAVFGYRLYRRSCRAIDDMEQRHITPVTRRVNEILDDVNDQVARARRAGDSVLETVHGIHEGVAHATAVVKAAVLPGWAVAQGVRAAVWALRAGGRRRGRDRRLSSGRSVDESTFVYEGGNDR